jgi:gluconolactonase
MGPGGKIYICNNGGFSWAPAQNGLVLPSAPSAPDFKGASIQRVDIASGKVETVLTKVGDHLLNGPNDLVFDKNGGLWFTDMGKRRPRNIDPGAFYYLKPDGEVLVGEIGMLPTNGIGLSPDEKKVYVVETPSARVWAFDIGKPGEIVPIEPIYRGERGMPIAGLGGYQMLDSLAMEACGNICVATLINGSISVFAPDGKLVEQVPTGDNFTTNIAFGGPELKTAYITLAGRGELVMMDWPRPGLPLNFLNR